MYPLFICASTNNPANQIQSSYEYINFYRLETDDGLSGYLNHYASDSFWHIEHKKRRLSVGYHDHALRGQLSNLSSRSGKIDFLVPRSYLSISARHSLAHQDIGSTIELGRDPGVSVELSNLQAFHALGIKASISKQSAEIRHQIGNSEGIIPFQWTTAEISADIPRAPIAAKLCFQALLPAQSDSLFHNDLKMLRADIELSCPLPKNLSLGFKSHYLHAKASLQYKGDMYGKIDNLNLVSTEAGISKHHDRWNGSLGIRSYHSFIGEDTYFDIWPFTAWDTFLAHRTRVKRFHINSISPFTELEYQSCDEEDLGLRYRSGIGYSQHVVSEDIHIRNRKVVVYPFLFSYEDMELELTNKLDAHVDLTILLSYRWEKATVSLSARQILPIDFSELFSGGIDSWTSPSSKQRKQSGGSSVNLQVGLSF